MKLVDVVRYGGKNTLSQNVLFSSIQILPDAPKLAQCMVIVGTSSNHRQKTEWTFDCFEEIFNRSEDIRLTGSAALSLADVARGRYGALFQRYLMPWDYAAGQIIIEEAGGVLADFEGSPLPCSHASSVLAAANETILKEMLDIVKQV